MKAKRTYIFHPLLFALFPVLFIFSSNLGGYRAGELLIPSIMVLAAAGALWAGLTFLTRNAGKSAITVTIFALFFSSYGHISFIVRAATGPHIGLRDRLDVVLIPFCIATSALCIYLAWKTKRLLIGLTSAFNVASMVLVAFSTSKICVYEVRAWHMRRLAVALTQRTEVKIRRPAQPRSIYYVILDAYGRADKLNELYGYDNSPTVDFLRAKGFFVAGKSRTNYSHTSASTASSMNFEYLGDLSGKFVDSDKRPLGDMTRDSRIARIMREAGYRVVSFNDRSEIRGADVYMAPPEETEFQRGLLNTTVVTSAARERAKDRARIQFAFDHLPDAAKLSGPCFIYAHIMAPHPPFVFDAEGGDPGYQTYFGTGSGNHLIKRGGITRSEYIAQYRAQLTYVNMLLRKAVEEILAASTIAPVIVLQGDHGPCGFLCHERPEDTYLGDRMSIFNAYYLPGGGDKLLYDSITPVNSFRVVLNAYFGARCSLAEDKSYFAPLDRPWQLRDVTGEIDSDQDRERLRMLRQTDYFP